MDRKATEGDPFFETVVARSSGFLVPESGRVLEPRFRARNQAQIPGRKFKK